MCNDHSPPNGGAPTDDDAHRTFAVAKEESRYETVIRGVATVTSQDPLAMRPLYHAIDPHVLEAAFDSNGGGSPLSITFAYQGCEIVATRDRVHVRHNGRDR